MSKIIVDQRVLASPKIILEGTGVAKKMKLRGLFQRADEANNNGRIYPKVVLESQVKALQEKIRDRALVGALDHPANEAIHLSQASHLITKLWMEGTEVHGEAEILSTPSGKIVEALLNDGVKIGISSRGLGTVSESRTGKIVNEDFKLLTFDLVSDPSVGDAYPGLTESTSANSEKVKKIIDRVKSQQIFMVALKDKINESYGNYGKGGKYRSKYKRKFNPNSDDAYDAWKDSKAVAGGNAKGGTYHKGKEASEEAPKEKPKLKQKKFPWAEAVEILRPIIMEGLKRKMK